ncbi:SH3 domain-containing protein [Sinomicrobium sp. M5D2P9]
MRVIITLICLIISVSSCKKNEVTNNSERKLQDKNSETITEKFSCNEGQNNIDYAVNHFKEIKKCIKDNDSYLLGLLTNIKSEFNDDLINSLMLLDSLSPLVDGADAETYVDVVFTVFKTTPTETIRYLCAGNSANMEKVFIDAVTFYKDNEAISKEDVQGIFQDINSNQEMDSCKEKIMNKILRVAIYRINDPDGYTNLRKGKGVDTPVIEKVKNKEKVNVLNDSGEWWEVQYGTSEGYIHKSRLIKI